MEEKNPQTVSSRIKEAPIPGIRTRIKWEYILIVILMVPAVLYVVDYIKRSTEVKQEISVEEVQEAPKEEVSVPKPVDDTIFNSSAFGTKINDWKKPESSSKGIIFLNQQENSAYLYQMNTAKVLPIPGAKGSNSGVSDYGETSPVSSPDRMYSVFLGDKDYVYLISNDSLESVRVSDVPATYITGWMGDSKRFIYYVGEDDIISRTENKSGGNFSREKFVMENKVAGFYLFNIETGETIYLYPVNNVKAIIGSDRVLVNLNNSVGSYVVFNVDTFEADYKTLENTGKDINGLNQIVTTEKGDKWSYSYSYNSVSDTNIIYANYAILPNNDGSGYTFVEQGSWGAYQWPKFSLDGTKIMFVKNPNVIGSEVYVYNIAEKTSKKVAVGFEGDWIDSEMILVKTRDSYDGPARFSVVNITTGDAQGLSLP